MLSEVLPLPGLLLPDASPASQPPVTPQPPSPLDAPTPPSRGAPAGRQLKRRQTLGGAGTVSRQFVLAVKQLVDELETTQAFFVRCIKPRPKPAAAAAAPPPAADAGVDSGFHGASVLRQLRYSGTIAALRLLQAS